MIEKFSIGIDIVDIANFENMIYASKRKFYQSIFLPAEIQYCLKFKNPYERFASTFAIKEAVQKSIREKIHPLQIMVSRSNSRPEIILLTKQKNNYFFIASISHDKKLAVGVVLAEKISRSVIKNKTMEKNSKTL